jgi:glycine/D-amino acid oxidase-like deaminating enzyme
MLQMAHVVAELAPIHEVVCASRRPGPYYSNRRRMARAHAGHDFIAAPHPAHPGMWLVGGESGHGFKHGPAMAERLAAALAGGAPLPDRFALGERQRSRSMRTAGSEPSVGAT